MRRLRYFDLGVIISWAIAVALWQNLAHRYNQGRPTNGVMLFLAILLTTNPASLRWEWWK